MTMTCLMTNWKAMMENTKYYCAGCDRELYGGEGYYCQMCEWLQKQRREDQR